MIFDLFEGHMCITLFRVIIVLCGTDNIMWNIPTLTHNVRNILHNIVSPADCCYGYE